LSKITGQVLVHDDECKGCGLCVQACPVHGLEIDQSRLNRIGYHPVHFLDNGCTGCAVCFYACPEPGALRVVRVRPGAEPETVAAAPAPVSAAPARGDGTAAPGPAAVPPAAAKPAPDAPDLQPLLPSPVQPQAGETMARPPVGHPVTVDPRHDDPEPKRRPRARKGQV
jgi:NAD-dependent dihydropyrimidine dehydrogenase PreA subunit